jgi:predicted DNA binding CopG/RHH family protein
MKRKTVKYTHEPITARVMEDFLPAPEALVLKDDQVKVTLMLSRKSIEFFKKQAGKNDVGYQAMIRSLVDKYAEKFSH